MATVEELERAVEELTAEELSAFRQWFLEYDASVWDDQIDRDVAAGQLDALADEALAELAEGRTRPL